MRLSVIDENTDKVINRQLDDFMERNAAELVHKSPREVIQMWLEWQFSRYVVDEQKDAFYVNDLETKSIVACITKKDPNAYQHAYKIRDDLNTGEYEGVVQVTNNHMVDELIRALEKTDVYTIEDVIDDVIEDITDYGDDE